MQKLQKKKLAMEKEMGVNDDRKTVPTGKLVKRTNQRIKHEMVKRLHDVKNMIDSHIDDIHSSIMYNVRQTIKYIQTERNNKPELQMGQLLSSKFSLKPKKVHPSLKDLDRIWNQVAKDRDSSEFAVEFKYPKQSKLKRSNQVKSEKYITFEQNIKSSLAANNTKRNRFRREIGKNTRNAAKKVNFFIQNSDCFSSKAFNLILYNRSVHN